MVSNVQRRGIVKQKIEGKHNGTHPTYVNQHNYLSAGPPELIAPHEPILLSGHPTPQDGGAKG